MPDEIIPVVSFDSTEITFDSYGYTWDTCHYQQRAIILANALKISGGLALVVEHGEANNLYSRLDVYHDISFSVKLTNPMFNDIGSHSVPFNVPASAHNLKVFGFPNRIERYTEIKNHQYPMYIYAEGLNILTGVLVITSADPSSIECYFKSGNGDFWSVVKGKSLKDVDMGKSPLFVNQWEPYEYVSSSTYKKFPEMPFAIFPVINNKHADITTVKPDWDKINVVNYWDVLDPNDPKVYHFSAISLFLYLPYIINKLFAQTGYNLLENFVEIDSELSTLVLYTPNSLYRGRVYDPPMQFDFNNYLIDYPISSFIHNLEKLFCSSLFVNDRTKQCKFLLFKDILHSVSIISIKNVTSEIIVTPEATYSGFQLRFKPDDVAYPNDLLKDISFGVMGAPVANKSQLPLYNVPHNSVRFVTYEDAYYVWAYNSQTGSSEWIKHTPNLFLQTNSPEDLENILEIETEIFTLPMYMGPDIFFTDEPTLFTAVFWPYAEHPGLIPIKDISEEATDEMTPRLLFYRGIFKDGSLPVKWCPLGTFDVYDIQKRQLPPNPDAKIPGANIALQWDGEYGLIENFYKEYLQWKMAGPDKLEFEAWLNVTEIASIDFSKKYAINNTHMFLDSVEFGVTPSGVTISKVKAYKI